MPTIALRARRDGPPPQTPLTAAADTAFSGRLEHWRQCAREDWRALGDPGSPPSTLPGYLLDRYAFRAFMRATTGVRVADRFSRPRGPQAERWEETTRSRLRGAPSVGLAPVKLTDTVPDTPLLRGLLARWRGYLSGLGINCDPALFLPPRPGLTWLGMYRTSVLHPFYPPALLGPSFVERVSERQRGELLARHGHTGIMSLYTFLLESHEDTHRAQHGEPLLCEYVLAMLWCRFLDENDQWYWERNDETGISLNVEEPYLRRVHLPDEALRDLFHDTASGAATLPGPAAYDELCLAGWLFDTRAIVYRDYLELVTLRLTGRGLHDRLASLVTTLDARLAQRPAPVPQVKELR
ncbi:hypothetical protein [Streptomyces sp. NPDC054863]